MSLNCIKNNASMKNKMIFKTVLRYDFQENKMWEFLEKNKKMKIVFVKL